MGLEPTVFARLIPESNALPLGHAAVFSTALKNHLCAIRGPNQTSFALQNNI